MIDSVAAAGRCHRSGPGCRLECELPVDPVDESATPVLSASAPTAIASGRPVRRASSISKSADAKRPPGRAARRARRWPQPPRVFEPYQLEVGVGHDAASAAGRRVPDGCGCGRDMQAAAPVRPTAASRSRSRSTNASSRSGAAGRSIAQTFSGEVDRRPWIRQVTAALPQLVVLDAVQRQRQNAQQRHDLFLPRVTAPGCRTSGLCLDLRDPA